MTGMTWWVGPHHGLAWPGGAALIEGSVDLGVARRVWWDLRCGGTLETFLESLLRHSETGLLALPAFAVALVHPESAHVAVRHEFGVEATSEAGEQTLAGGAVSTWAEVTVRQVTALTLTCGAGAADGIGRPIVDGVVPCGRLALVGAGGTTYRQDLGAIASAVEPAQGPIDVAPGSVDAASDLGAPTPRGEDTAATSDESEEAPVAVGAAPGDAALEDAASEDAASEDAAPEDAAPEDAAPEDAAPEDAAPEEVARTGGTPEASQIACELQQAVEEAGPDERFGHIWDETMTRTSSYAAVWDPDDHDAPDPVPSIDAAPPRDPRATRDTAPEMASDAGVTAVPVDTDLGATRFEDPDPRDEENAAAQNAAHESADVVNAEEDEEAVLITSVPMRSGAGWPRLDPGRAGTAPARGLAGAGYHAASPTPAAAVGVLPVHDVDDGDGDDGDHDGMTIARLPVAPEADPGVEVRGLLCPAGHPNPAHRPTCFRCGARLLGESVTMRRPALGHLHVSNGEIIDLEGPVIAGRNPRASRVQGPLLPRLLALPHPHVSGNHVEITLEDWKVLARDLHSTNGTLLRRRGEPPVRLPDTAQLLVSGDVLDLGHGVQLVFEDLP